MERFKNFIKYFLPILFVVYVGCLIAFTHVHIVNGVTIVHSHPYKMTGGLPDEHEHDYAEFQLLHQLTTIVIAGAICALFILKNLFHKPKILLLSPVEHVYFALSPRKLSLRAPPLI